MYAWIRFSGWSLSPRLVCRNRLPVHSTGTLQGFPAALRRTEQPTSALSRNIGELTEFDSKTATHRFTYLYKSFLLWFSTPTKLKLLQLKAQSSRRCCTERSPVRVGCAITGGFVKRKYVGQLRLYIAAKGENPFDVMAIIKESQVPQLIIAGIWWILECLHLSYLRLLITLWRL